MTAGWFGVLPSSVWEHTKKNSPATLRNIIVRVFDAERQRLVNLLHGKLMHATDDADKRFTEDLNRCSECRAKIESDSFQKGMTGFLAGFYAQAAPHSVTAGGGILYSQSLALLLVPVPVALQCEAASLQ